MVKIPKVRATKPPLYYVPNNVLNQEHEQLLQPKPQYPGYPASRHQRPPKTLYQQASAAQAIQGRTNTKQNLQHLQQTNQVSQNLDPDQNEIQQDYSQEQADPQLPAYPQAFQGRAKVKENKKKSRKAKRKSRELTEYEKEIQQLHAEQLKLRPPPEDSYDPNNLELQMTQWRQAKEGTLDLNFYRNEIRRALAQQQRYPQQPNAFQNKLRVANYNPNQNEMRPRAFSGRAKAVQGTDDISGGTPLRKIFVNPANLDALATGESKQPKKFSGRHVRPGSHPYRTIFFRDSDEMAETIRGATKMGCAIAKK